MTPHSHHPYHLVDLSPWPLTASVGALGLTTGFSCWFHYQTLSIFLMGALLISLSAWQWWRDISRESAFQGHHSTEVVKNLRWGMILFIVSEVLFFFSFFWSFFHSSLAPSVELGTYWPPVGIHSFHPWHVPLLNTSILLASGVTVTWAHHSLMHSNFSQATMALTLTIFFGVYFFLVQMYEYYQAKYAISDSVFGSTFFVTTGFHGLHVIIGTIFLTVCLLRMKMAHFSKTHHFGFEAAAWYWHFVDVVWLFLFVTIYWWGGEYDYTHVTLEYA